LIVDKKEHTDRLDVPGARLEYRWLPAAENDRPVLVLLHEGLGCVAMWRDLPERLAAQTGCGVFAYSRRGYGGSSTVELPRPTRYMHDEALQVLPAVLEVAGISSCVIVGHSDGGSIGIIYAGAAHASGLRGLVLLAPHVFNEAICVASIRAARAEFAEESLRNALEKYHGEQVDVAFRGWSEVWLSDDFQQWNIEEYLPRIVVPVLVIQGRDDEYGTLAQIEAIDAGLATQSGCDTVLIDNCGHAPQRDAPERVVRTLADFVSRVCV